MSVYAVLLKDPGTEPLAPLAFLASAAGLSAEDARLFLRRNPGFLARSAPFARASALAAAADAAGFPSLMLAETELPALQHGLQAEKVEPAGAGLQVSGPAVSLFIPYDTVTVLCAAAWDADRLPDTVQALKPGLAARLAALAGAPVPPQPSPARETFFRADLVGGEGPLRLLLRPEALDFSALPGKPAPSSLQNLRALLDLLSAQCFRAVRNPFLAAFIAGRTLAPFKAASEEAADAGLARLLLLSRGAV